MQTVAQAVEIVSYVTATPRNRVNQLARQLVTAGIFPKSAGRDVKKINGGQLVGLIAAVAFAENVADAPHIARVYADLPARFAKDADSEPEGNLAHFFELAMTNPHWVKVRVEFGKTEAGGTALLDVTLSSQAQGAKIELPFWESPSWGHFCKTSFTISPEGFEVMRNLFARDDVEGMSFSLSTGGNPE